MARSLQYLGPVFRTITVPPEWQALVPPFLSPWSAYALQVESVAEMNYWAVNCIVFTGISTLLLILATSFFRKRRLQDV